MNIQFSKVDIGPEEIEAVTRVMQSGWIAPGPETAKFEDEFSNYISPGEIDKDGNKYIPKPYYCIFTNSGTSALKLAYKYFKSVGFETYDLLTPNTFCATYSAAEEMGLRPAIGAEYAVKVATHYGGIKFEGKCDLEDSAHRIEQNDPLESDIRIYSFYATKNMTTGSGGMFVTNNKEIYEKARLWWKDGLSSSTHDRHTGKSWDYDVVAMAGGYDGNDISAAIGRVQLRRLPDFTRQRNEIRDRYNEAFGANWLGNHLYPYFTNSTEEVRSLIEHLKAAGVGCGYFYPKTGWLGVSLPIYPLLTEHEQQFVIETVRQWQSKNITKSSG